jgi:putative acetyltransferase
MGEATMSAYRPGEVRGVRVEDATDLHRIYMSKSVLDGMLGIPYTSEANYKSGIEKNLTDTGYRCLVCTDAVSGNKKVIGVLGLSMNQGPRVRHTAHFHIAVDPEAQGVGVGTKLMQAMIELAFGYLNIHRLEMTVFVDNDAAIALYKKFGFEIEGTVRDMAYRNGKYVDAYSMSRLRVDRKKEEKVG